MDRCLTLTLLMVLVGCAFAQRRKPELKVPEVDQRCMECICQASSNCDTTIKCHNTGPNYFCGPYVISWPYWHDGGRPGDKGRAHDFEACLNNKTCAEEAVRGYMRKYGQDCDVSGKIDCRDFARIHKLGFGSCGGNAIRDSDYWQKFEICYDPNNPSYNNGDLSYHNEENGDYDRYDYGDGVVQARRAHLN